MFWVTEDAWITEKCLGLLKNVWVTEKCSGAPNEPGCLGLPNEPENQNLLGSMSLGAAWGCPSGLGARICWGKCCLKLSGPAQWAWEPKSAVEHAAWGCQWTGGDQPAPRPSPTHHNCKHIEELFLMRPAHLKICLTTENWPPLETDWLLGRHSTGAGPVAQA